MCLWAQAGQVPSAAAQQSEALRVRQAQRLHPQDLQQLWSNQGHPLPFFFYMCLPSTPPFKTNTLNVRFFYIDIDDVANG